MELLTIVLELGTPGSAIRLASVARHVTDCATGPGIRYFKLTNWVGLMLYGAADNCPSCALHTMQLI